MILQQFGGVNAISFYASSIFISAGTWKVCVDVSYIYREKIYED